MDWLRVTGYDFDRYEMSISVKTFKLTISVKEDISDECVTNVMKYLTKICSSLFAVVEFGAGDRKHFHAALLFKTAPAQLKKWKSMFYKERVQPYHPDSLARIAVTCITMYNHGWYDEYLRKEDKSQIIFDSYDRDAFEAAFPDEATQSALKEKRDAGVRVDPVHVRLVHWYRQDYGTDAVTKTMWCEFINECFVTGRIDYRDERQLLELTKKSFRYLTNDIIVTQGQEKWVSGDKRKYDQFLEEHAELSSADCVDWEEETNNI